MSLWFSEWRSGYSIPILNGYQLFSTLLGNILPDIAYCYITQLNWTSVDPPRSSMEYLLQIKNLIYHGRLTDIQIMF